MKIARFPTLFAGLLILASRASGDVRLSPLFSDNMVLQRNLAAPVWGTADAGEFVTVSIGGQQQKTVTQDDGKWLVNLAPMQATESVEMTIAGKNTLTIKNIAIGEVWLASGQSNMQMKLSSSRNAREEIAASADPSFRMFTVKNVAATEVQATVGGDWKVATPVTSANFSGVAYFFARELRKKLNCPVGIIHSSWGGTPAQAWTSRSALEANPAFKTEMIDRADAILASYARERAKYHAETLPAWQKEVDAAKAAGTALPTKPEEPRGAANNPGLPASLFNGMIAPLIPYGIAGVIWYQGESNSDKPKQYQTLFPTLIKDWRSRWNQGELPFGFVQLANLNEQQLQPVEGGWAEIREAQMMTLALPKTGMASAIDLGESYDIHPKNKQDVGRRLALWALATVYGVEAEYSGPLYDSMSVEGNKIRLKFKHVGGGLVAKDNSARFADETIVTRMVGFYNHFNALQEAGLMRGSPVTYEAGKPLTRRQGAQIVAAIDAKLTAANDPGLERTALAAGADRTKARAALAGLRASLAPQIADLKSPLGDRLRGFAIAGADGKWVWGDTVIDGDTVIVSSSEVLQPVAVRYGWANNAIGNLYNRAGLPASSFRTDIPK